MNSKAHLFSGVNPPSREPISQSCSTNDFVSFGTRSEVIYPIDLTSQILLLDEKLVLKQSSQFLKTKVLLLLKLNLNVELFEDIVEYQIIASISRMVQGMAVVCHYL